MKASTSPCRERETTFATTADEHDDAEGTAAEIDQDDFQGEEHAGKGGVECRGYRRRRTGGQGDAQTLLREPHAPPYTRSDSASHLDYRTLNSGRAPGADGDGGSYHLDGGDPGLHPASLEPHRHHHIGHARTPGLLGEEDDHQPHQQSAEGGDQHQMEWRERGEQTGDVDEEQGVEGAKKCPEKGSGHAER